MHCTDEHFHQGLGSYLQRDGREPFQMNWNDSLSLSLYHLTSFSQAAS